MFFKKPNKTKQDYMIVTCGPQCLYALAACLNVSSLLQASVVCRDHRLERMEAMEKQIASLTGLVQSVLTRAPDSDST